MSSELSFSGLNPVGSHLNCWFLLSTVPVPCSFSFPVLCPAKHLNGCLAMTSRAHRSRPTGEIVVNMEPEVPIKKMDTMVKLEAVSIRVAAPLSSRNCRFLRDFSLDWAGIVSQWELSLPWQGWDFFFKPSWD